MTDYYLSVIDEYLKKATKLLIILNQNPVKNEIAIIQTNTIIKVTNHLRSEYLKTYYPDYGTRWIKSDNG